MTTRKRKLPRTRRALLCAMTPRRLRTSEEILRDGFPANLIELTPYDHTHEVSAETVALMHAVSAERQFASLAHTAVHSGDDDQRAAMRSLALQWILSGDVLPPSLREWLFFVLYSLDGALPHTHKGRPYNGMSNRHYLWELGRFVVEYRRAHRRESIAMLRAAAAKQFHKSARTIERHMTMPHFRASVRAHEDYFSRSPR